MTGAQVPGTQVDLDRTLVQVPCFILKLADYLALGTDTKSSICFQNDLVSNLGILAFSIKNKLL